jgi:hypothetical protein
MSLKLHVNTLTTTTNTSLLPLFLSQLLDVTPDIYVYEYIWGNEK